MSNLSALSVLLCTQGTYPFHSGGVSTWCDQIVRGLPGLRFHLYAVTGLPMQIPRFPAPANLVGLTNVPLWGEPNLDPALPARRIKSAALEREFAPPFRRFVRAILAPAQANLAGTARAVYRMWLAVRAGGWESAWRASATWNAFVGEVKAAATRADSVHPAESTPALSDLIEALHSLQHYLRPLAAPLPRADVVHSTLAGFPGLAGIIARFAWGTPFIVTEHGVFMREQYLALTRAETLSPFMRRFLLGLSDLVCRLSYHVADAVTTIAEFNRRWQIHYGVDPAKTRVIYNGIDTRAFTPPIQPAETQAGPPTVVAATRIVPVKDIQTMIRAAACVAERLPDAQFEVFGGLEDAPDYAADCRALIAALNLTTTFHLRGHHPDPRAIYALGQVSTLSSITEGVPYALLESMACGVPPVATDVGGVPELLEGCGLVVPPRDPRALGDSLVRLLTDEALRRDLGQRGRRRVAESFDVERMAAAYHTLYQGVQASTRSAAS